MKPETIRKFIETRFLIDDATTGEFIPFKFNKVQEKYWKILEQEYPNGFQDGLREMVLKARKEGFTSLILAIFAAHCLLSQNAIRFLEISYKEDATSQHFRRFKNFILSHINRDPKMWTKELERSVFKNINEGSELVLAVNQSSFYCGTANSKVGERGGTVQGILYSEGAHYPNTTIIRAAEIIDGTSSLVMVGSGMIFQETTANGFNFWKRSWDMAGTGELNYKRRFFGWQEFYTPQQFAEISKGFTDKNLIPQEYPATPTEAFLSSGRPAFNVKVLEKIHKTCEDPIYRGFIEDDKKSLSFVSDSKGPLSIWKLHREDKSYLITSDIAGGLPIGEVDQDERPNKRCWSVATVWDRSTWEVVAELRMRCDPGTFGRELCILGEWYNWAALLPELNNHGHATIEAIKAQEYPHLVETRELWPDKQNVYGFPTDSRTKVLIISALRNAIADQVYKEVSKITVEEMIEATFNENGEMVSSGFLDGVISRAIGIYALKFMTVDETYRNTKDTSSIMVTRVAGARREHRPMARVARI